jgi:ubiquinone/menaquinone biosynthesis C-methylase UbiE
VARNIQALKEMFRIIEQKGRVMGFSINEEKTKYMRMSSSEARRKPVDLTIDEYKFKGVSNFSYLGASLKNENRMSNEISQRIMAGNRAFYANLPLLRSNLLSKTTKLKL